MDKILVTGASGFLASRLIEFYKHKYNIIPVGRNNLDITDEKAVTSFIKDCNPDYVLHTAAIADTGVCERDPELSYKINVEASINIAKACSTVKSKLIYCSSEQVYNGNIESGPYSEEIQALPNTVYGRHKLMAEEEISKILEEVWCLRLTWMFGLPEKNKKVNSNIVWNIMKALMKNEPIKLPSNEYRGMTYVYDVIENFENILGIPYGVYNTGSENELSTYDIGEIIIKSMGFESRIPEILIKDTERYKECKRDLRITNSKFKKQGINFEYTSKAIKNMFTVPNIGKAF